MQVDNKPFQIKASNPEWQKTLSFGAGMLPWQQNAFKAVRGARFTLIVAFMGSGKSFVQLTLGADEIRTSKYQQKQLVIVPQSHIHGGFVHETVYLNGKPLKWEVLDEHKFLSAFGKDVISRLKKWLLTPGEELFESAGGSPKHLKGLTSVTSHSALALAWNGMTPAEKKKAIHNLTLRVDEAHHINNILTVNEPDLSPSEKLDVEREANNLGQICTFIMKSSDETARLALTTATPFRGDQDDILMKGAKKLFKVYYLPFFDHWSSLGIKNFGLDYLIYKGDPIKMCLNRIKAEPNERHMVIVPATTRRWRVKGHEHHDLLTRLNKMFPGQVLDLVTKETQKKNLQKLFAEPRKPTDGESKIRVVVTCMLGREGTDWCPCSRLHNLSVESTITLAVQTLGRPFRRFAPNKTEVFCFNYVPEFASPEEGGTVKEVLSHRTNALLTCMIFDEGFHPVILPSIPGQKTGRSFSEYCAVNHIDYGEIKQALVDLETNSEFSVDKRDPESVREAIQMVMEDLEIPAEDREMVYEGINKLWGRMWVVGHREGAEKTLTSAGKSLQVKGLEVDFLYEMGYDKLVEFVDDKDKSTVFTGVFAERDLRQLKTLVVESFEQRVERIMRELSK